MNTSPKSAKEWYEEGRKRQLDRDLDGALNAFRASLKLNPRAAAPWVGLAEVLDTNLQSEDALACLQRGALAEPANPRVLTRLARAHQSLGQMDQARDAYDKALLLDPDSLATQLGIAGLFEDQGEREQAAAAYRRVLQLHPTHAEALSYLLGLGRHIVTEAELGAARSLIEKTDNAGKAFLGYGLGKALDSLGETDEAFKALQTANQARQAQAGAFDSVAFERRLNAMRGIFSGSFFGERRGWGVDDDSPVFIVGLPRSGTTLTEQIAASHPLCHGAGELGLLSDLATGTPDRLGRADPPWPDCAKELTNQHAASIGHELVIQLHKLAPTGVTRIIDKAPLNFWHLGLIAMATPNARIINCVRDVRDVGFSIYSHNFNQDQRWSTDLSAIATYWQGYRQLMEHWREVTPLKIFDMCYEETIAHTEDSARALLAFLELPWDEKVLEFYEHKRAVQTPSRWQVRQPIYQTSKARWQGYEKYLGPLCEAASGAATNEY